MPFINIHIGKQLTAEQKAELYQMVAEHMPILPTKDRDNTMVEISAGRDMYMGGEPRELIFVDMRVFKPSPEAAKREFIATLGRRIRPSAWALPADRQYYNIIELDTWGAHGKLLT